MIKWRALPLVRLLVPYLIGCLLQQQYPELISLSLSLQLLGLTFLGCILIHIYFTSYSKRWMFGCGLFGIFLLIGYHRCNQAGLEPLAELPFSDEAQLTIQGQVYSWKNTTRKRRVELNVESVIQTDSMFNISGSRILVYLPLNEISRSLDRGDRISIRGQLRRISPAKNPEAFDLQSYFHYQHIHFQVFSKDWRLLEKGRGNWLHRQRQQALNILGKQIQRKEAQAVLSAMVLGERDMMDESVRTLYTDTGAVHVLAVSGLHVGLIYLFVAFFTRRLPKKGAWKFFTISIQLGVIWLYAFLTGASPSVLRAATMFSFICVGRILDRRSLIYNTLAASALVLLLIEPFLLWQVGFQLSYLAVLGIVFFQPKIAAFWRPSNRLIDYSWQLTSVSLAAQLSTFPLSLYYFHQFPTYFWLSSLVVIPAAPLIIGSGLGLLLVQSFWEEAASIVGDMLEAFILFINRLLELIGHLPFSIWKGIGLSQLEMLMLYILLFCLGAFWVSHKWVWVKAALWILLIWSISGLWKESPELVVYASHKGALIDIFTDHTGYFIKKGSLQDKDIEWIAGNYRIQKSKPLIELNQADQTADQFLYYDPPFLQAGTYQFFLLDEHTDWNAVPKSLAIDYLLVTSTHRKWPEDWLEHLNWKEIWLVNGSIHRTNRNWIKTCKRKGYRYRNITESGAIRIHY